MLQSVLFPPLEHKDIEVRFDEQASSSDGGSVLLKACNHALGLTETVAASLQDPRQPGKITHQGGFFSRDEAGGGRATAFAEPVRGPGEPRTIPLSIAGDEVAAGQSRPGQTEAGSAITAASARYPDSLA